MARRRLNFHWHLRRVMAAHDIWQTTQLVPLLRERGVELSATQVYRLVTDKPERLSLRTLTALCDIFDCTPADLIEPYVEAAYKEARNHKWYMTSRLICVNDLYSFDPNVEVHLEDFEDILARNFRQPEEGLGFDNSPVAHMWRTMMWPTRFL